MTVLPIAFRLNPFPILRAAVRRYAHLALG